MEAYQNAIKRRMVILCICAVCAALYVCTAGIYGYHNSVGSDEHARDFYAGAATGMFAGMVGIIVWRIIGYARALKDAQRLRKLYVYEHDERNQMIQTKTGGAPYQWATAVILFAGIGALFLSQTVGATLMTAGAFMVVLRLAFKIHYRNIY